MTRFKKFTLGAMLVTLVGGGVAALHAQGLDLRGRGTHVRGRGGPGGRGFAAGFALGQLNLSDAQKQQVRDIAQRHRQQTQPLVKRLQQAREAQLASIEAVPVNESLVRSTAEDLAAVQADMAVERARLHSDIFGVLTAEQQEKASELRAQAQARAKERHQRAPREPQGQL